MPSFSPRTFRLYCNFGFDLKRKFDYSFHYQWKIIDLLLELTRIHLDKCWYYPLDHQHFFCTASYINNLSLYSTIVLIINERYFGALHFRPSTRIHLDKFWSYPLALEPFVSTTSLAMISNWNSIIVLIINGR